MSKRNYPKFEWIKIMKKSDLNTSARLLARELVDLMYEDGKLEAWPSVRTLMAETGLSRRGVIYALKELENAGLILRQEGGHSRLNTSLYTLLFPNSRYHGKPSLSVVTPIR